ncbi:MAG: methyltransferase domain-containing protein, partial [Anaerolineae bacterium]|nr:methyltransferase domain-containing protein [Anaerolineae bacterium]
MSIDFGKTADDYKTHRQGFPPVFFDRLADSGLIKSDMRVLDLGTGTGTIARNMALRGCRVIGLDIADKLIAQAKILDAEAGVTVDYIIQPAEETGLPNSSVDMVTAGQCWHWFDHIRTLAEAKRILTDDGVLVIAYLDWIPLAGNVVELTEALISA